jgi:RNA polymerase sigma-70 factor (ECF subfamily)
MPIQDLDVTIERDHHSDASGVALSGDARLVERAASGDADAFDLLIRPRLDRLFRMSVAILRSEADARDAVQEACVHAWRELPRLRDRDRFDSWLSQIVVNACRSLLRRERRIRVREIDVAAMPTDATDPALAVVNDAESIGEVEAIRRAFERLDPATRSLLALHYVEEQPLAAIATAMGAPVGTIKWRLSNARRALDRALEVERR